ncbi:YqaE/Pmp3 family membrane protein [Virgibacillus flavescens]|uniref:YqaE/Pmp3 family membrane protein n=1 Tax=Virgibacillus flavescens TaxID=1611422 RepID=UPI003D3572D5
MSYILAILLPPVAVFFKGRPMQVLLNILLTIIGWIPGAIHAVLVVNKSKK